MKKVSIIVPVYNTRKYLPRCLEALVNQPISDYEILLINDGSTDDSQTLLMEYQKSYPEKVRVINKENGGQATARNLGIKEAVGEYIGFADSDDHVDVSMFAKMYELAKKEDADLVECGFHFLEEKDSGVKELQARGKVRQHQNQKDMFIDPQVSPWNKLYRASVLKDNNISFPEGFIYEDTAFYIKSIPYVNKSAYLDEKLVFYYLRGSSTMNSNTGRKVADIFSVVEDIINFYKDKGLYQDFKDEIEYFCSKILLCSSLSRIGRVNDKVLRKSLLDRTFEFVNLNFKDYKSNKYYTGKTRKYICILNRRNSGLFAWALGKVMRG